MSQSTDYNIYRCYRCLIYAFRSVEWIVPLWLNWSLILYRHPFSIISYLSTVIKSRGDNAYNRKDLYEPIKASFCSFQPSVSILWYSFSFPASTNTHESSYTHTHIRWLHTHSHWNSTWLLTFGALWRLLYVCRKYKGPHLHLLHLRVLEGSHTFYNKFSTCACKDHVK